MRLSFVSLIVLTATGISGCGTQAAGQLLGDADRLTVTSDVRDACALVLGPEFVMQSWIDAVEGYRLDGLSADEALARVPSRCDFYGADCLECYRTIAHQVYGN